MLHQLTSRLLYWSWVATQKDGVGNPKYNSLMVVVKAALCTSWCGEKIFHQQACCQQNTSFEAAHNFGNSHCQRYQQIHYTRKWNKYQPLEIWFVGLVAHMQLTLNICQRSRKRLKPLEEKQESLKRAKETESLQQKQKDAEQLIWEANDHLLLQLITTQVIWWLHRLLQSSQEPRCWRRHPRSRKT